MGPRNTEPALVIEGGPGDRRGRQHRKLAFEFFRHPAGQLARGGQKDGGSVHVVLGLREHVGGEPLRVALSREDDNFGGSGDEVDAGLAGDELFGGRDIDVAGANDAIDAGHGFRAVGQRGDGLGTAHAEEVRHAEPFREAQNFRAGVRASGADGFHSGHLRGNHVHEQSRGQRIPAGGRIGAHGIERADDLAEAAAVTAIQVMLLRKLKLRIFADIRGGGGYGLLEIGSQRGSAIQAASQAGCAAKLQVVFDDGGVAAGADSGEDGSDHALGLFEALRFARKKREGVLVIEDFDHNITILFNGYSTMPWAPASLRRGMIVRTVDSSRMVFTASQLPSLSGEMVGFFKAGSTASTAPRRSFSTFSIKPTLPSALMAPSSSMRISSSLRRLCGSFHESRLAMSWVLDSSTVSTMRSLFARSDDPVSVTSTMASASTGGFTSVAPQLNSTFAVTPRDSR